MNKSFSVFKELSRKLKMFNGVCYTPIKNDMDRVLDINSIASVKCASKLLHNGDVIALPTDTVYGLACSANDPKGIQRLYDIKGRDNNKPVAICVADIESLRYWGEASHLEEGLLSALLPGAVTIVLYKSKNLDNPHLNPGVRKIGIRIPDFHFIRDLCYAFALPLALTSANRSNEKSTLNINEFQELWPKLGAVFDGGQLRLDEQYRLASTVIDLSTPNKYKIIREGIALSKTKNIMKQFNIIPE